MGGRPRRPARHRAASPTSARTSSAGASTPASPSRCRHFIGDPDPILFTEKLNLKRPVPRRAQPAPPGPSRTGSTAPARRHTSPRRSCTSTTPRPTTAASRWCPAATPPGATRAGTDADPFGNSRWTPRPTPTWSGSAWRCRPARSCSSAPSSPTPPGPNTHRPGPPRAAVQLPARRAAPHSLEGLRRCSAGANGLSRRRQSTEMRAMRSAFCSSKSSKLIFFASKRRWISSTRASSSAAVSSVPGSDGRQQLLVLGALLGALVEPLLPLGGGLRLLRPVALELLEARPLCGHASPSDSVATLPPVGRPRGDLGGGRPPPA